MKKSVSFYAVAISLILCGMLLFCVSGEVDKTYTLTRVIDGDTFEVSSGERIRLADVDCPEYYESGYSEATDFMKSLVDGKTVYLDIDDVYRTDLYERLVCVVFVDCNLTHYMNTNQALLDEGHAIISNYNNEFNPYSWSLLVAKNGESENPEVAPYTPLTPTPKPGFSLSREAAEVIVGLAIILVIVILAVLENRIKRRRRYK